MRERAIPSAKYRRADASIRFPLEEVSSASSRILLISFITKFALLSFSRLVEVPVRKFVMYSSHLVLISRNGSRKGSGLDCSKMQDFLRKSYK